MCRRLILMCISVITFCSADVKFRIKSHDNTISCIQSLENPEKATVLEKEKLTLSAMLDNNNKPPDINCFECFAKDKPSKLYVENPKNVKERNSVNSIEVTSGMSGLWVCKILTHKDTFIQPVVEWSYKGKTANYTQALCYVSVHVRLLETPQIILVNNMILPTNRILDTHQNIDHSAVYNYSNGDIVNVSCIPGEKVFNSSTIDSHLIDFKYDFAENLDDMFKNPKRNKLGYGFRTKLEPRHNNSKMTCKYFSPNLDQDFTIIQITFVVKEIFTSKADILINDLIVRPAIRYVNYFGVQNYEVNYLFLEGQAVNFTCKTNENDLKAVNKYCRNGKQSFSKHFVAPFEDSCLICNASYKIIENISVNAKQLATNFKETKTLTVDLPKSNILLDVYTYDQHSRQSWVYYEFNEGDNVTLKCTKSQDSIAILEIKYKLDEKDIGERSVTLTSEYDNSLFKCLLMEKSDKPTPFPVIYVDITVLFRMQPLTTTSVPPSTADYYEPNETMRPESNSTPAAASHSLLDGMDKTIWAIAAGGVLMCIILICVVCTIYKMRKRSQKRVSDVNNYENFQNHTSEVSIPPYPKQWSRDEEQNYHVPVDIRNDTTIYAEPVRGPEDPYAVPIPKSQRKSKVTQDDAGPTYAELNLSQTSKVYSNLDNPQYTTVKELYTQVVPKNLRKNNQNSYGNVFPDSRYVNSENTEYVEPTYCQPHIK